MWTGAVFDVFTVGKVQAFCVPALWFLQQPEA